MSELDPRLGDAVRVLREPPPVRADARSRLRRAIAAERRIIEHSGSPPSRVLVLSPWRAALAAGLLVLGTSTAWLAGLSLRAQARAAPGAAPVQFVLVAADARRVNLVGDFNDWDPQATPLSPGSGGVWSVVLPLSRGRFSYSFLVDEGEWRADPHAATDGDDFGRPTSVVFVSGPETAP